MLVQNISFKTPQENILFDDALLYLAEKQDGQEVLRFWESSQMFVVLGRISKEEDDLNLANIKKDNISVLRRSSGGGTVLQGKGCLNYSLILSKEKRKELNDLKESYRYILGNVVKVLKQLGIDAEFYPISDIALSENKKKISGNAQKRGRKFILHHGTILYDFNLNMIEQYLKIPKQMPEYRGKRNHLDFVDNVKISVPAFQKEMAKIFHAREE